MRRSLLISAAVLFLCGAAQSRPFIIGADISGLPQSEDRGTTYWDKGAQKDLFVILKDHKFNFIRLRIFVNPSATGGYSPGKNWCGLEETMKMAKRIRGAGMNFLLDFHMSDTWASIGVQKVPSSWSGKSDKEMQDSAYGHVKRSLQALVAQGTRPDWVQVGNEINSCMSGVCTSDWPRFAALVNAGVKAVREVDPAIKVVMQHGRPRPDGNFQQWVDGLLKNNVDFDIIGGSTYGTTNNGGDWRDMFPQTVTKTKRPVVSLEYVADKTTLVNDVMFKVPNQMGMGGFLWEPTFYEVPIFTSTDGKATGNKYLEAFDKLATDYQATLYYPFTPGTTSLGPVQAAGFALQARDGRFSFIAPRSGKVRFSIHTLDGKLLGEWDIPAQVGSNTLDGDKIRCLREFGPKVLTLRSENGSTIRMRWAGGIPSSR
ncbi:MAG: glycosyl hydrolase 53 family protein [Fibrobacteria bacterium]